MAEIENLCKRLAAAEKRHGSIEAAQHDSRQLPAPMITLDSDTPKKAPEERAPHPVKGPEPSWLVLAAIGHRLDLPRLDMLTLLVIVSFLTGMLLAHLSSA